MKNWARAITVVLFALIAVLPKASKASKNLTDDSNYAARGADIYCTGIIAESHPKADIRVVGAVKEGLRDLFVEGDTVFLDKGSENSVQKGSRYTVVRPMGDFKHPFSGKRMGFYMRELGVLTITDVQKKTSSGLITFSCDSVMTGDELLPFEVYTAPQRQNRDPLPRAMEGAGELTGQIVLAPGFREYLSANQVCFIDIGARDGAQVGDYFTILRTVGKSENIPHYRDDEVGGTRNRDFGSDKYKGGDYSMNSRSAPLEEVLKTRPQMPRKVVGEMVILRVQPSTAVALITRTSEEVNLGDSIERFSK